MEGSLVREAGRLGLNSEMTFAAVQRVRHRGREQDEDSGADDRSPEVAWTRKCPRWEEGQEGTDKRCHLKLELIGFADVKEEDRKGKGGVKMNPTSGIPE